MSESQFVRRIEPTVKKSSLDGHQLLTPPPIQQGASQRGPAQHGQTMHKAVAAQPAAKPSTHGTDVVITSTQPIDARMQPGGVQVKSPTPAPTPIQTQNPSVGPGVRPAHARATVAAKRPATTIGAPGTDGAPTITTHTEIHGPTFTATERDFLVSLVDAFGQNAGGAQLTIAQGVFTKLHELKVSPQ